MRVVRSGRWNLEGKHAAAFGFWGSNAQQEKPYSLSGFWGSDAHKEHPYRLQGWFDGDDTKTSKSTTKKPVSKWLTGAMCLSSIVAYIGGAYNGWPIIAMSREADEMLLMTVAGLGACFLIVLAFIVVANLKSDEPPPVPRRKDRRQKGR